MIALQPTWPASGPYSTRPTASPNGQLAIEIAMAVTISRPANQSVTILATSTVSSTAPVPEISRPAAAVANDALTPITTPPIAISAKPTSTTHLAPKRWPSMPPGSAITMPGNM